jgi:hypothetical protein
VPISGDCGEARVLAAIPRLWRCIVDFVLHAWVSGWQPIDQGAKQRDVRVRGTSQCLFVAEQPKGQAGEAGFSRPRFY